MNIIYTYAPFLTAFLLGFFLLHILFPKKDHISLGIHLFLALGLGMGLAGLTGFISLLVFNQYHGGAVFLIILLSTFACAAFVELKLKISIQDIFYLKHWRWQNALLFLLLGACAIPFWDHSHFYLYGGWDAWQTWNLKAKFIFLGGTNWTQVLSPVLWRSSPHYPLLVPLMNTFGYTLHQNVHLTTNVLTSFFFSFFTVGLLVNGLLFLTKTRYAYLVGAALLTMPRFMKLSLSQYADAFLGYYLLAALLALILAKKTHSLSWIILAGIFLGLLSFTKNEGMALAFFITLGSLPYLFWRNPQAKKMMMCFGGALCLAGIWTLIFKYFYSPGNLSFTNGWTSAEDPSTFQRLKIILYWYYRDFISPAYHGLWMICTLGLVMSLRRCFNRYLWIIPAVLVCYFTVITLYYQTNTYFDIVWWLQVSLHRINFALIPLACLWTFLALWQEKNTTPEKRPDNA